MKKTISILMICFMLLALSACGSDKTSSTTPKPTQSSEMTPEATQPESDTVEETTSESEAETETASTLVVFFSNTGNTKAIAEHIANRTGAVLYEIIPETPYTEADLNYNDNNSRSTLEMNDPSARPAIVGTVENFEQYDMVYIGYPIWWGEAPRIMSTFVESYDFTDKTVIPFCTSASSGVGSSDGKLEEAAGSGNWLDGKRFSGSESEDEVMEWVNGL